MNRLDKAFVVIPAFNEQMHIADVIDAAQNASPDLVYTDKVVVVDNNSSDATAEIARTMGAEVLYCSEQGKGWAMQEGANFSLGLGASALTFLDADLKGLKPEHINVLTEPVLDGVAVMTIGYLGGRKAWAKKVLQKWGGFSGQRSVSLEVWDELEISDFENWRIEGALNAVCRNRGVGNTIQRIELEGVRHTGKRDKEPTLFKAGLRYCQTYSSAIRGLLSKAGQ